MIQQLDQKYKPKTLDEFVGLCIPRAMLIRFAREPYSSAWLFTGPSGTGKTTAAFALAQQLGGQIHHVPSQSCDVSAVREVCAKCFYCPWGGGNWNFIIVDECDKMSGAAQLAFLSKLDGSAAPPDTIFLFSSNGLALETRFLSRCKILHFDPPTAEDIAEHLALIYQKENGPPDVPNFRAIAESANGNVRSAVNALEMELLVPGYFNPKLVLSTHKTNPIRATLQPTTVPQSTVPDRSSAARRAWETRRKKVAA